MPIHLSAFSLLTGLIFSSMTYAANEPLGQWPAKPVSVKPKPLTTIFGPALIGDFKETPKTLKAIAEMERQAVLPQNTAKIPQFTWRNSPELLRAEDITYLNLTGQEVKKAKTLIPYANQVLQQALIPALKEQRYLITESEHRKARVQLANLARQMNQEIMKARSKSWTIEEADKLYRSVHHALAPSTAPSSNSLQSTLICAQTLTDMVDYIYKPDQLRFEQYATLMNQRKFCGKFPSLKMDKSLNQAYHNDDLRLLLKSVARSQRGLFNHVSQKFITDITGFTPTEAIKAANANKPFSSAATPATSNNNAANDNPIAKIKGLNGELPQKPFKYSFEETDQVGYYLERAIGNRSNGEVQFTGKAMYFCGPLHPEFRVMHLKPMNLLNLQKQGIRGLRGNLLQCSAMLNEQKAPGSEKLALFVKQYLGNK